MQRKAELCKAWFTLRDNWFHRLERGYRYYIGIGWKRPLKPKSSTTIINNILPRKGSGKRMER